MSPAPVGRLWRLAAGVVLPLLAYLLLRGRIGDVDALAAAGAFPVLWTLGLLLLGGRVDRLGLVSAVLFGAALLVTVESGGSELPLKLGHAALTGGIGLACLLSAALGRPLLLVLPSLGAGAARGGTGRLQRLLHQPRNRAALGGATVYVGLVLLVDAAAHVLLAIRLPTAGYVAVAHGLTVLSLGAVALLLRRFARGLRGEGHA